VQRALKWCFRQPATVSWDSIGILAPRLDLIEGTPFLRRLRVRGSRVATPAGVPEGEVLDGFTGPLITFHPDPATLEAAEQMHGVRGIVAVSGNNDWLRPWVSAHQPERLGGVPL
jgi:hypothetical protein